MTLEQRDLVAAVRDILYFFAHTRNSQVVDMWDSFGTRLDMIARLGGFLDTAAGEQAVHLVRSWALESIPVSPISAAAPASPLCS